ncbi:MAG: flagellar hook-basal body complex protein FliE [Hyphomicrobiales bacterium]|nr:MAG: flagellar hook-basal body complex protein FliE [Hyphomicrobiales bacterium]
MSINPLQAAKAYAAGQQMAAGAVKGGAAEAMPKADFGALLNDSINGIVETGTQAENTMMSHIAGKQDVVDVVTAVAEAEVAVKTLVSVRDRVISAYQDIMKMPI